jgi:hypothetical protein
MSCKAASLFNEKVLERKQKHAQNIFLEDADLEKSTSPDPANLPDFDETKFVLVLINSCDIATRREGLRVCT